MEELKLLDGMCITGNTDWAVEPDSRKEGSMKQMSKWVWVWFYSVAAASIAFVVWCAYWVWMA